MGPLSVSAVPALEGFAVPFLLVLGFLAWIALGMVLALVFGAMASGRDRLAPTPGRDTHGPDGRGLRAP